MPCLSGQAGDQEGQEGRGVCSEGATSLDFPLFRRCNITRTFHCIVIAVPAFQDKLEIKKDKKGMVFVQGAAVKEATNAKELNALFEEGSKNRHTASTSKLSADFSCR